ncbi:MAG TPA: TonB family protein [Cyclobacteriaceae bacterium]|nr:TonB family protein [Cyclobacteriaceae bacterium]
MNNLRDDIIKYKNGELTAKEMHALEKKALNDPFLADALEGIENVSTESLAEDIADLNQKILKPKKTVLFTPLRIAAGVILAAASIIVFYQWPTKNESIALKKEKQSSPATQQKTEPANDSSKQQAKIADKREAKRRGEGLITRKADRKKEKLKETEVGTDAVTEKATPKTEVANAKNEQQLEIADTQISPADKKPEEVKAEPKEAPVSIAMQPTQQLATNDDAKKENISARSRKFAAKSELAGGAATGAAQSGPKRITGKVTAAEDGSPLPGVNVIVAGTTQGTVTDTQGNFSLQPSNENQKLVFSFIGMETQEVSVADKDNVDVSLKQDVSQLSEVVVAGLSVKRDDDAERIVHLANPVGGMRAYNKYLDKNVRYPQEALKDNIKGKVKVEFSVKIDGTLDDYKVVKSLGHGCDEEVIRLIKEGPKWSPTTENGQPVESTVLVGVKFDPAKAGR